MGTKSGAYQDVYIKREDEMVSLKNDVTDFCEKYIKPVHTKNWDWSTRDFEDPKNIRQLPKQELLQMWFLRI